MRIQVHLHVQCKYLSLNIRYHHHSTALLQWKLSTCGQPQTCTVCATEDIGSWTFKRLILSIREQRTHQKYCPLLNFPTTHESVKHELHGAHALTFMTSSTNTIHAAEILVWSAFYQPHKLKNPVLNIKMEEIINSTKGIGWSPLIL